MLMHELKTPLSVVSMALGTRDNKERNLELASRAVMDMKAIIERCISADRSADQGLVLHSEPLDLGHEIRRLTEISPDVAQRVRLELPTDLQVDTDRQLLQTVLSNLMDNAVRYGDPSTPIELQAQSDTRQQREGLLVRIRNTPGTAGWPDPARLFSKYYRASGAQRESGSGLGLYLASQLVGSLGGHLRYAPTDHHIQFELWIPRSLA